MDPVSVLLVDDNLTFLRIASRFLRMDDDLVVVGLARGGQDALAKALDLHPQVVLLDLQMPSSSGLELIPLLRTALSNVVIIVLTLFDTDSYRQAAMAAGADDLVSKARMETDLLPAIWQAVQIGPPADPKRGHEDRDRDIRCVNKLCAEPRHLRLCPDPVPLRSQLAVPIQASDEIAGMLDTQSPQPNTSRDGDVVVSQAEVE